MANPDHIALLRQSIHAWNTWRRVDSDSGIKLDLRWADLRWADLCGVVLSDADLRWANLTGAGLHWANLAGTDLHWADLHWASLTGANFRGANLREANLNGADLRGTNFSGADLRGVNFSGARLGETTFGNLDLSEVIGLETCRHEGPSILDHSTLQRSGPLPPAFLQGCGLPDPLIDFLPTLLDRPIQYYSCFIIYSSRDELFVRRLQADLQLHGIRCWSSSEDIILTRRFHEQIATRSYDKLLLVLSAHSMNSEWIKAEISRALQREAREKQTILFPVRLVDFETLRRWECGEAVTGRDLAREIREYYPPDFSNWRDYDAYQHSFNRLLRVLKPELERKPGE
ncbi:MAG: toll/interleukin-1 receptor domain-containing protein [Candidatus Competibacteraceae bacterium]